MADNTTPTIPAPSAAEPTEHAEKVTFSDAQQSKLEAIVREVSGRVAHDLRQENAQLKREVEAAKAATPAADTAVELATTRAELEALKRAQRETRVTETLRSAVGSEFLDRDLAVDILRSRVKVDADGKVAVVSADGAAALNKQFQPMSLKEAAEALGREKPFLVRGTVKGGVGSTPSQGAAPQTVRLEDLFGRHSKGSMANQLAIKSPGEYRRLRALAAQRGLI